MMAASFDLTLFQAFNHLSYKDSAIVEIIKWQSIDLATPGLNSTSSWVLTFIFGLSLCCRLITWTALIVMIIKRRMVLLKNEPEKT